MNKSNPAAEGLRKYLKEKDKLQNSTHNSPSSILQMYA